MCKLLTEPRLPKDICGPKKKTRRKKGEPSEIQIKYTTIREGTNSTIDELFRLYKVSPYNARVKFFNTKAQIHADRVCIFEKGEKDFEICIFRNKFGISTTNRIYSSQRKIYSISYKTGKFWYIDKVKNRIGPLTYGKFCEFIGLAEGIQVWASMDDSNDRLSKSKIFQFMRNKFPWILTLAENKVSLGVNFNVVESKGLTTPKAIHRHVLNVPSNIAQLVLDSGFIHKIRNESKRPMGAWKEMVRYLDGIEHLSMEMLKSHYFEDSLKMAKTLGRKVNCRWGEKRLKEEHDNWAREIGNIVLDCELEYDLNIRKLYEVFAEFSGYKLLKTNKEMILEGMIQNHCVGTYIDKVQTGTCAIYHVDGYTLQVGLESKQIREPSEVMKGINGGTVTIPKTRNVEVNQLKRIQFKGKHNSEPPQELIDRVDAEMKRFSDEGMFDTEGIMEHKQPDRKKRQLSNQNRWDYQQEDQMAW